MTHMQLFSFVPFMIACGVMSYCLISLIRTIWHPMEPALIVVLCVLPLPIAWAVIVWFLWLWGAVS